MTKKYGMEFPTLPVPLSTIFVHYCAILEKCFIVTGNKSMVGVKIVRSRTPRTQNFKPRIVRISNTAVFRVSKMATILNKEI